jgi:hypothetical protein
MGARFDEMICEGNWEQAKLLLRLIEDRSASLLEEINKEAR